MRRLSGMEEIEAGTFPRAVLRVGDSRSMRFQRFRPRGADRHEDK